MSDEGYIGYVVSVIFLAFPTILICEELSNRRITKVATCSPRAVSTIGKAAAV